MQIVAIKIGDTLISHEGKTIWFLEQVALNLIAHGMPATLVYPLDYQI